MSGVDRLLTSLGLGFTPLAEVSFALEWQLFGNRASKISAGKPVFIIGHARAGTTILTRALHLTGEFASLTYRDMPFPLASNFWDYLMKGVPRSVVAKERGHGDGLMHDLESPEALEEFFWRTLEGSQYIRPSSLTRHRPSTRTMDDFFKLMSLVMLRYGSYRYLSKNNNNVLRIASLAEKIPEALFIHPVRHPLQHVMSLLKQHNRTIQLHLRTPYSARYMRWLAHHEFGVDHRPFALSDNPPPPSSPTEPEYWLRQWISTYSYLRKVTPQGRSRFVSFDFLCHQPIEVLGELGNFIDAPDLSTHYPLIQKPSAYKIQNLNQELTDEALSIYKEICGN